MSVTAKITSKGQLTLPRHVREALDTDTVEIEIIGGKVVLRPVRSVAGVLAKYASGEIPLQEVRDKVWQEVADDAGKR
ncbi:MAG: AbrB/MazE/SpoVT family DNA-binding domain-containing protein [Desulfurivibrio sp.]|jgi:AbrB family looped-hinge helix DNA binding protein|nr:MAG: AbrB/MazE/SpoVT family DNA-binding domain-containing protein [Desulfurivibrio sp.]